jgi:hypothetical protein
MKQAVHSRKPLTLTSAALLWAAPWRVRVLRNTTELPSFIAAVRLRAVNDGRLQNHFRRRAELSLSKQRRPPLCRVDCSGADPNHSGLFAHAQHPSMVKLGRDRTAQGRAQINAGPLLQRSSTTCRVCPEVYVVGSRTP